MSTSASADTAGDGSLAGRTLLMSGGSRGIGLAIAERAAADGANVAIIAKTATRIPSSKARCTRLPR
jgi:citronellol/citronellal dehydrogenase